MWHNPTIGENRLDLFLKVYREEAENWSARHPDTWAAWLGDERNMEIHLDLIAALLRTGRFDPTQMFFRAVLLRLGVEPTHKAITAWIRGS